MGNDEQIAPEHFELFIIGGGIHGCAIARDAAGRGLSVALAEKDDLASGSSSASTKLLQGGVDRLETLRFSEIREALLERNGLMEAAPHLARHLRLVVPLAPEVPMTTHSAATRLVARFLPWIGMKRPAWLIRMGFKRYDRMAGGLASTPVDLSATAPLGRVLRGTAPLGYEVSEAMVDDARLTVVTAADAAARGARIWTRTRVHAARREKNHWRITLQDQMTGTLREVTANAVINAAGPWAGQVLAQGLNRPAKQAQRLMRGSHIVTRRLYDHDRGYIFEAPDRSLLYILPFEDDYTLIGSSRVEHLGPDVPAACSRDERDQLCARVSALLDRELTGDDVLWSYSGLRPIPAEEEADSWRRPDFALEEGAGAPLLTLHGGRLTTHRRTAEEAVDRICASLEIQTKGWTQRVALPGGNLPPVGLDSIVSRLRRRFPFLSDSWARRLVRSYGMQAFDMMATAASPQDMGRDFGATLSEREVRWLMQNEFARTAEDVLWRRGKLGLRMAPSEVSALQGWMTGPLAQMPFGAPAAPQAGTAAAETTDIAGAA
ncbi:glycerol-3-phosphate dehydrogenase [Maritimibacter alkaliphilus]|uniref:glycerol-3-phosphate dehydrogenase n=1 Tax=Maritimibacter alkaliphilus TaxID=404236 RepID=UPI001C9789AC|nr:glycerol-3-phosphate dehydrogenase [Maritimibacter alkaliphilus]MBY6088911.1 glycerol-3-phosphate dehydrogenase [Maritimibacter alkaliphilus]